MNVQHNKQPVLIGVFVKDGDTDANVGGIHLEVGTQNKPILIEHGLNRIPVGYQVIWAAKKAVGVPYIPLNADGEEIKDERTIQLVFDAEDTIINLRIW